MIKREEEKLPVRADVIRVRKDPVQSFVLRGSWDRAEEGAPSVSRRLCALGESA